MFPFTYNNNYKLGFEMKNLKNPVQEIIGTIKNIQGRIVHQKSAKSKHQMYNVINAYTTILSEDYGLSHTDIKGLLTSC